jgi:hypothetical protein
MAAETSFLSILPGILAGVGVGTIAAAFTQHFLARRGKEEDVKFAERKEAFSRLLVAIAALDRLMGDSTNEAEVEYAHAAAHVQLVGSKAVVEYLATWRDTDPGTPERNQRIESLLRAMRRDLGVAEDLT